MHISESHNLYFNYNNNNCILFNLKYQKNDIIHELKYEYILDMFTVQFKDKLIYNGVDIFVNSIKKQFSSKLFDYGDSKLLNDEFTKTYLPDLYKKKTYFIKKEYKCKYDGFWSLKYDFGYVDKRSILKITINKHENITINKGKDNYTYLKYLNFTIKIKNGYVFIYKRDNDNKIDKFVYRFNRDIDEDLEELDGIKYMVYRNDYSTSYYIIKMGSILLNNVYENYDVGKEFLYIFLKDVEYLLVLRYDMINDICYIENTPIMFLNGEDKDDLSWLIYASKKLDIL